MLFDLVGYFSFNKEHLAIPHYIYNTTTVWTAVSSLVRKDERENRSKLQQTIPIHTIHRALYNRHDYQLPSLLHSVMAYTS